MKKLKYFISAALIIALVGGSLAYKAYDHKDLLICDISSNTCQLQTTATKYSSTPLGAKLNPPPTVFKATSVVGATCFTPNCQQYTGDVYNNQ